MMVHIFNGIAHLFFKACTCLFAVLHQKRCLEMRVATFVVDSMWSDRCGWGHLLYWIITIFAISCQKNSREVDWGLTLSAGWYGHSCCKWTVLRFCDRMLLSAFCQTISLIESGRDLIEVPWVNVVYLIHIPPLWFCIVKSFWSSTMRASCCQRLNSGVDKAWNGRRRIGYTHLREVFQCDRHLQIFIPKQIRFQGLCLTVLKFILFC